GSSHPPSNDATGASYRTSTVTGAPRAPPPAASTPIRAASRQSVPPPAAPPPRPLLARLAGPLDGGLARTRARGLREHQGIADDDLDLHERQQQEQQDRQQEGESDG